MLLISFTNYKFFVFYRLIDIKKGYHVFEFNHSIKVCNLQVGVFRITWKQSTIRPIPKVTSPNLVSEFRPISMLCTLSKSLEHIVIEQ